MTSFREPYESVHRIDKLSAYAEVNQQPALNNDKQKQTGLLNPPQGKINRVRPVNAALTVGEYALDTIQIGVMGAAADGTVTYANAHARAELKTLALANDSTGKLADGSICQQLIQQVLADNAAHGARLPGPPALPRIITAFPAPHVKANFQRSQLDHRQTAVVLVFSKPGQRSARPSLLMEWFGLSAAEARLANALAAGGSIEQYASTYSISVATARTQLRAILKKTGVDRQQEVVRLLASLPAI